MSSFATGMNSGQRCDRITQEVRQVRSGRSILRLIHIHPSKQGLNYVPVGSK